MLPRSDVIPSGGGWTFEPKLDGFRCLVCTHATFRAREIDRVAVTEGMRSLWDDGVAKIVAGLTTVEELARVATQ